ncbi:ABC transporter ATP-binding protein [Pseudothauera rhizosphaerae]|uniref:ABC transporter ATP-binding protein n=1 Tax=Pseudothauera rhizosphaerae TaxID=2565932 RepID=A0A4S4AN01_9RHOO|nr:ABC transporter ATP-binding protein [Pseudothauera rhizosphaerae]THF61013.1 ABC transporter ATP-binding protein [Pseudothauera rhizosphaerae]
MILLQNLAKTFRRARVLNGIDLAVGLGERVALIGSNGAGKTTLIRCLLGEYACDGTVRIDGLDPRRQRTAVLGKIGFVPQLPPPLRMPVGQLIEFSAALCGTDPARIAAVAGRLGLDVEAIRTRQFVRLSGGMKQKLLIAIALGRDARLLIMDEPAANLDPEARKIFFDLLAQRLEDATMIISSHRLDEVSSLVNRVVEMDMGRVVLDDKVAEDVALTDVFACRIVLKRFEPAFAKALDGWNFDADAERLVWQGAVAGPDRLRFLGLMSRYTGLVSDLSLMEG